MNWDLNTYSKKLTGAEDERAVSPVIGVILMVAITVILAAVIATFVMDMGDLDDSAPNAQFSWEIEDVSGSGDERVTVTHTSGDDIDTSTLDFSDSIDWYDGGSGESDIDEGDTWSAGETIVFESGADSPAQIVWESDGSSTILDEYEHDL